MTTLRNYLRNFMECVPDWLVTDQISLDNFFRSRTVFYPGSGNDGHAVAVFNASRTAHCFVYVDARYDDDFARKIAETRGSDDNYSYRFKGYGQPRIYRFCPEDFVNGKDEKIWRDSLHHTPVNPLIVLAIYNRLPQFDDEHGGKRIAVLFVRAEANAFCQVVFGRSFPDNSPFAILLQDHGFGGNRCAAFRAADGPIAQTVAPRFLLVGDGWHNGLWRGYREAPCELEFGGQHRSERKLYERPPTDMQPMYGSRLA